MASVSRRTECRLCGSSDLSLAVGMAATPVAEKYVDLLADYGVSDETFKEVIGTDGPLDDAISYYLDLDNVDDDEEEWDE